jgi:hypothetical protein
MGNIKTILLGIAIAIISVFFVGFGIQAFYPAPEFEDYCKEGREYGSHEGKDVCESKGGKWREETAFPKPVMLEDQMLCTRIETSTEGEYVLNCKDRERQELESGYCDMTFYCEKDYKEANEGYTKILFIVASFIGLVVFIIGGFVLKHESVSPGLMGGGFLTIFYGIIRYWEFAGDKLRFFILGLILAMLIYLGYRKLPFKKKDHDA